MTNHCKEANLTYTWPLPLHELHFWKPLPLQIEHLEPPDLPVPLQKEQSKGPVPDPLQEEHSFAIALLVKASTPAVVANHFKALRRLILATLFTPNR